MFNGCLKDELALSSLLIDSFLRPLISYAEFLEDLLHRHARRLFDSSSPNIDVFLNGSDNLDADADIAHSCLSNSRTQTQIESALTVQLARLNVFKMDWVYREASDDAVFVLRE
jgi:hypothetical protein